MAAQPAAAVRVIRVETAGQLAQCQAVRAEVFIDEQGVSVEEELDGLDEAPGTCHVLALAADGTALGTARILPEEVAGDAGTVAAPPIVHVGRVAVRATARGTSIGRRLMEAAEALALREHGAGAGGERVVRVELAAQETALGFYERLGYEIAGDRFLDADIWHRRAWKVIRGTV